MIYDNTPIFDNIDVNLVWKNSLELQSFPFKWEVEDKEQISDCPFITGSIPVFSKFAFNVLKPFINEEEVQVIPIHIENLQYFIFNVTMLLNNILNVNKSRISYFTNGEIMDIDNYVFNNLSKIPPFFKISQLDTYTFITGNVADIISKSNLTGIEMEECRIIK